MILEDDIEVEKPWEERVYDDDDENIDGHPPRVYDDDDENIDGPPPQPVCTGHKDCFCQKLTQQGFLRKLERSALIHFNW